MLKFHAFLISLAIQNVRVIVAGGKPTLRTIPPPSPGHVHGLSRNPARIPDGEAKDKSLCLVKVYEQLADWVILE